MGIGILWNIIEKSRKKKSSESDSEHGDSETDSMDLDLENTDLESRVGGSIHRPPSRAASRVSTIRSSTMRVRSPRRFSFTPSEPPDYAVSIIAGTAATLENGDCPSAPSLETAGLDIAERRECSRGGSSSLHRGPD